MTDAPAEPWGAGLDAVGAHIDCAVAVWDAAGRLRWANARFRRLIPALADDIRPGLHFESWLYKAAESGEVASARKDRQAWRKHYAEARAGADAGFETELAPGAWYNVREARLADGGVVSCWTGIGALTSARRALRASEERWRGLVELAADAVLVLGEGRVLFVNRVGAALFGAESPEAMTGLPLEAIADPADAAALAVRPPDGDVEAAFRALDGAPLPLLVRGMAFCHADRPLALLAARDLSARKRAEAAARAARRRLAAALEEVSDAVALFDADDRLVLANRASRALEARVGGVWRPGATYRAYLEAAVAAGLYPEVKRDDRETWIEERIAHRAEPRGPVELARQNGRRYRLSERRLDDGGLLSVAIDITERRADERRIRFLAHHDALTELPNRALFMGRLAHSIEQAEREGRKVAVLMIDLDNFKQINDNLGHSAGDRLLVEIAARLRKPLRAVDTAARLGGDEFAIVQASITSPDVADTLAHRALAAFEAPIFIDNQPVRAGASIGVTLFPDDARDIGALLRNADLALYHAKSLARANAPAAPRIAFYTDELSRQADERRRQADERLAIAQGLRRALDENRLVLHYQPTVGVDNSVVGGEALLRWRHPERGLLLPGAFIGHAEATGLIAPIGEWVLDRACEQIGAWVAAGVPRVPIWINVSAEQFKDPGLHEKVRASLKKANVAPEMLGLEITESALFPDAAAAGAMLGRLRKLGVSLAIDDFGTGYSSFRYLKQFPVDKLKIDRSFVPGIVTDEQDLEIVRAIVRLGQNLDKRVVAEGVETDAQMAQLIDLGCEEVQGNLIRAPEPPEQFGRFVAESPRPRRPGP